MTSLISPFLRGVCAGLGRGPTLTYDNHTESPRSQAFDRGMNLGERLSLTAEIWNGDPTGPLPRGL